MPFYISLEPGKYGGTNGGCCALLPLEVPACTQALFSLPSAIQWIIKAVDHEKLVNLSHAKWIKSDAAAVAQAVTVLPNGDKVLSHPLKFRINDASPTISLPPKHLC